MRLFLSYTTHISSTCLLPLAFASLIDILSLAFARRFATDRWQIAGTGWSPSVWRQVTRMNIRHIRSMSHASCSICSGYPIRDARAHADRPAHESSARFSEARRSSRARGIFVTAAAVPLAGKFVCVTSGIRGRGTVRLALGRGVTKWLLFSSLFSTARELRRRARHPDRIGCATTVPRK